MRPAKTSEDVRPTDVMADSLTPFPVGRLRVLVIEDDEVDRLALRRHVAAQNLPYDLTEAASIEEAKRFLAASDYDALVLDHHLPDGSGFEFFQEVADTPVVFVTGVSDLTLAVRAMRAGAVDYLVKDGARGYLKMLPFTLTRAVRERRTRSLLKQSQQLSQQVFDRAPIGNILTVPDGRVLVANPAACAALGYGQEEMVTGGLALLFSRDDLADWAEHVRLLVTGVAQNFQLEKSCRQKNGAARLTVIHASLIRGGNGAPLVCVMQLQDVTEARRMEQALRASENLSRHLLDSMPAAVFASDAAGLITYFNPQTAHLWGRDPRLSDPADRFCGTCRMFEADGAPIPPERSWMAVALAERRVVRDEGMVIEFAAGRRRNVLAYSSPVIESTGALTGAINILVDVTDLKRLEQHRRTLEAQLQHSHKLEAIGTLAGGVAHEFNNLLTSILGNIQLAELEAGAGHSSVPFIMEAVGACRRARNLVARMLTFSREAEGERTAINLSQAIADAESLLQPMLPAGIELKTSADAACPPVWCNACELNEALLQLGLNAGHAMSGRGGVLEMALRQVGPAVELREQHPEIGAHHTICLSVRDTGSGMSAEVLGKIFEPFYTTKQPGQGTGLGLAGVYGFMKRQRGAVVVESAPGAGTTVRLFFVAADASLPLDAGSGGPPGSVALTASGAVLGSCSP